MLRGFARPNLALRARHVASERERDRQVDAQLAEALGAPGAARGTAIVYAPTRRSTEEEAARLAGEGLARGRIPRGDDAATAGRAPSEPSRTARSRSWWPPTPSAWASTAPTCARSSTSPRRARSRRTTRRSGAPGATGSEAFGLLLHSPGDLPLRRRLIEGLGSEAPPRPEVVEHKWSLFLDLMRWAEGGSCRHDAILRYFGDEAETLAGCGRCDVCREIGGEQVGDEETSLMVRKALSAVARVDRRYGLTAAVKLLAGLPDPRLARAGLDRTPTFGALREHSEPWLTQLLRRCVTAGWVDFTPGDKPIVLLTRSGRAVMKGDRPARLVLPREGGGEGAALPRGARTGRPREATESLPPEAEPVFEALRLLRLELAAPGERPGLRGRQRPHPARHRPAAADEPRARCCSPTASAPPRPSATGRRSSPSSPGPRRPGRPLRPRAAARRLPPAPRRASRGGARRRLPRRREAAGA